MSAANSQTAKKHYKCSSCKKYFRKPGQAENHVARVHRYAGFITFDAKGSSK